MKITIEQLQEKGACEDGVKMFARFFPNGFDGEWTRELQIKILTKTRLRQVLGWAARNAIVPFWSMSGADLYGADLSGADLYGADLSGANLYGANLYGANLYGARYTKYTIWPQWFDPKAAGAVEV